MAKQVQIKVRKSKRLLADLDLSTPSGKRVLPY